MNLTTKESTALEAMVRRAGIAAVLFDLTMLAGEMEGAWQEVAAALYGAREEAIKASRESSITPGLEPMILDFPDATAAELGEILWSSFIAVRLCREDLLRAVEPRPEWSNQDADTKALWLAYAERLRAFYQPRT
jgi:hypothetical protein